MHSTAAFPHSCSIASAILFRMWNNDFVKEGGMGQAFYSQGPCLSSEKGTQAFHVINQIPVLLI